MFDELKPLLDNGERYIVVESGRPEYVIMRFRDYVRFVGEKPGRSVNPSPVSESLRRWEAANAELAEVRRDPTIPHYEAELAGDSIPPPVDPTSVRLEDLPL